MKYAKKEDQTRIDRLAHFKNPKYLRSSGMFRYTKRLQLLGEKRIYERREGKPEKDFKLAKNTFWYRTRNQVRTSLIDLELFITSASKHDVNYIITAETLKPIVNALLGRPIIDEEAPDQERAKIAELFIEKGFEYLLAKSSNHNPLTRDAIEKALSLSSYLVGSFRGK